MCVEFCRFTCGIMKKACGFWRNSDNLQGTVELQFFGNMRVRFCGSQKIGGACRACIERAHTIALLSDRRFVSSTLTPLLIAKCSGDQFVDLTNHKQLRRAKPQKLVAQLAAVTEL